MFRYSRHLLGAQTNVIKTSNIKLFLSLHRAFCSLHNYIHQHLHIYAQHKTYIHNQAHSKQRTTHTQKHDMLSQHQS